MEFGYRKANIVLYVLDKFILLTVNSYVMDTTMLVIFITRLLDFLQDYLT